MLAPRLGKAVAIKNVYGLLNEVCEPTGWPGVGAFLLHGSPSTLSIFACLLQSVASATSRE